MHLGRRAVVHTRVHRLWTGVQNLRCTLVEAPTDMLRMHVRGEERGGSVGAGTLTAAVDPQQAVLHNRSKLLGVST